MVVYIVHPISISAQFLACTCKHACTMPSNHGATFFTLYTLYTSLGTRWLACDSQLSGTQTAVLLLIMAYLSTHIHCLSFYLTSSSFSSSPSTSSYLPSSTHPPPLLYPSSFSSSPPLPPSFTPSQFPSYLPSYYTYPLLLLDAIKRKEEGGVGVIGRKVGGKRRGSKRRRRGREEEEEEEGRRRGGEEEEDG